MELAKNSNTSRKKIKWGTYFALYKNKFQVMKYLN